MLDPRNSEPSKISRYKIVLIYAVIAGLWILISDAIAHWFFTAPMILEVAAILKGWLFVGVTSLLLYYLLGRSAWDNTRSSASKVPRLYGGLVNWKRWQQYLFAAAVTLVTVLLRLSVAVSFGERPLLILFMLPIILSAAIGGFGPGLLATIIAGLSVVYYTAPSGSFSVEHSFDWLQIGFLIVNGLLVSYLSMRLHEARYRSDSERTAAQINLAEKSRAMQLLDALTEGSTDAIFAKDVQGKYLLANSAAARFVGKSIGELLGKDDTELFPPDQAALIRANDRQVMLKDKVITYQEDLDTKDGKLFFLATKGPLRDLTGRVIGIFGISRDITNRKIVEDTLREQTIILNEMSSLAHIGGWSLDPRTGLGSWTAEAARIHDLPEDSQINFEDGINYYVQSSRPIISEAVRNLVENAEPYDLELEIRTATGRSKWIRTMGLPIIEDGKVTKIHGVIQDITEKKKTDITLLRQSNELRQHNEELERFNRATIGRELDMIELKRRVNELSQVLGKEAPYDLSFTNNVSEPDGEP